MISYDYITKENIVEHYLNWPQILEHPSVHNINN